MNNIRSVLKLKLLYLKVYSDYIVFFKYGFLFFCKIIDWGLLKGVWLFCLKKLFKYIDIIELFVKICEVKFS